MAEQVQLRTLRIAADMDASRYEAGAAKIAASGKTAAQANAALVQSFTSVDKSITLNERGFTSLERQFVEGVKGARDFAARLERLSGVIERNGYDATRVSGILDGMYKKYGLMADASTFAARGQVELANAVNAANVRFIEQQANATKAAQSVSTHGGGMVAANQNIQGASSQFRRQNLTYQLFDIGQTAAMGMNPAMILAQQGPQIAQIYAGAGGLKTALGDIVGIAKSAVSAIGPVGLAITGLVAGGGALAYAFTSASSNTKKLNDYLKENKDIINDVKSTYEGASSILEEFAKKGPSEVGAAVRLSVGNSRKEMKEAVQDFVDSIVPSGGLFGRAAFDPEFAGMRKQITDLADAAKAGTPDMRAFREAVEARVSGKPELREVADKLLVLGNNAFDADRKLRQTEEALGVIGNTAKIEASKIASFADALKRLSDIGKEDITDYDRISALSAQGQRALVNQGMTNEEARRRVIIAEQQARQRVDARFVTNQDGTRSLAPVPEARPNIELEGLPGQQKKTEREAEKAKNAYRDMIKTANDRIDQMRLETRTSGETGIAAQKLAFELDLLQKAQDKGRKITEDQRKEIESLATAFEQAATASAKVKLSSDLQWETQQLYRSSQDQQIAARLRGAGLPVDVMSQEGQQIRSLMSQQTMKSDLTSFLDNFRSNLIQNGGKFGESFVDAFRNAALKKLSDIGSQAMDKIINWLVSGFTGSNTGTGATSVIGQSLGWLTSGNQSASSLNSSIGFTGDTTTLGSLLGLGGGSSSVSQSPAATSGTMSMFREAIASIESKGNGGYAALGPLTKSGDRAYGRYQVMGNNIGPWSKEALGRSVSASEFMANPSIQDSVFDYKFGSYVNKYGATGASKAWFGGPGAVGGSGNATDILGTSVTGYAAKFNSAMSSMTDATTSATKGLTSFGTDLTSIGKSVLSGSGSASGGAFSNLFSANFKTNTTLSDVIGYTGGKSSGGGLLSGIGSMFGGLFKLFGFADGTESSPGGVAMVGERGRELVNLPRGSQVIPNHRTEAMLNAANSNRSGEKSSGAGTLQVVIQGASGDDHVRTLVQQGVDSALSAQRTADRRGGAGAMYDRWQIQKG